MLDRGQTNPEGSISQDSEPLEAWTVDHLGSESRGPFIFQDLGPTIGDENIYLGASPTAAGPQTGMGLPNGLRRRKFWSSEIPVFRIFDKIAEKQIL